VNIDPIIIKPAGQATATLVNRTDQAMRGLAGSGNTASVW
jgi:hypothetical protein